MKTRQIADATAFLTERLGHTAAPSWRYDLMRCVPKLVKTMADAPETPGTDAATLKPQVEAIIARQCEFSQSDPVGMQRHVALIIDALGELHGEHAPRDTAMMRPLRTG